MSKKPKRQARGFFDEFRDLILNCGKTPYAIARDSNGVVDRASLSRFLRGKHGLSMAGYEAIADQLKIRPTIST